MKKLWIVAVLLVVALAFGACGGADPTPAPVPAPVQVELPDPVEPPPVAEPEVEEPAEEDPIEDEPIDDEPADDEPADDEPADDEPADDEPADDEPADDEPADDEPADDEPADDEPADDPVDDEPAAQEPPPAVALPAGTPYALGAVTAAHNWAPGWNTDGRDGGSYALQMDTLQSASHLVLEFAGDPETVIEIVMQSDGNGWSWTQVPVWDSDDADGNYTVVVNLTGISGWSDFVSSGPAFLGVGGLGGQEGILTSATLILN